MCTSIAYDAGDHYFGRNLDLSYSYHETVTVVPHGFHLSFRHVPAPESRPAIIGMAYVCEGYPLYYDAVNEFGLAMAGLNFPGEASFGECEEGKDNIAVFEVIPWVLSCCHNLKEAKALLSRIRIVDEPFCESLPVTPEHWSAADVTGSIVIESTKEGIRVYDNPTGVMTNSPAFPYMLSYLRQYRHLSPEEGGSSFAEGLELPACSLGMAGFGLPGDLSSPSRFVRAAYTRLNSVSDGTEEGNVSQFFHILGSVAQTRGCVRLGKEKYETTIYSSCMNLEKGIYYYRTYENSAVQAVDLHRENLEGAELKIYPLKDTLAVNYQN
ncbi:MAG: choloylglycine hydrolase [Bilifractor sp.]|jgi:choloylglycine hydrolase